MSRSATDSAAFSLAACPAFVARTACQMLTVRPTTKAVATAATAEDARGDSDAPGLAAITATPAASARVVAER